MRLFADLTVLLLAVPVLSAPIFQTQVDSLRAGGMSEVLSTIRPFEMLSVTDEISIQRDILVHLHANHPTPAYTGSPVYTESQTSTVYGQSINRDTEGDVSPGSAPEFHFAEQRFMNQVASVVGKFLASDNEASEDYEASDRPAWIFEWMGGVWRSAASKKPRAKWIS